MCLIRDGKDITSLHQYLIHRTPFVADQSLRNILSGVTCDSTVNSDKTKEVGCKILKSMAGNDVVSYTFKKNEQVVTMDHNCSVKVDGEVIQVDPQLLFQRLLAASSGMAEAKAEIFKYELCSQPSALLEPSGLPREAKKSVLADVIWTGCDENQMSGPSVEQHAKCARRRFTIAYNAIAKRIYIQFGV